MNRIHQSKIWAEIEQKDKRGNNKPFSFSYAKKDGTIAEYSNAVLSSIHYKGSTINIMLPGEVKPHTFRRICFLTFNGLRTYL